MLNERYSIASAASGAQGERNVGRALLAAAIALPGTVHVVHAETAPEKSVISYKHLDYRDNQPGLDRIDVRADAFSFIVPFNEHWSVNGSYTIDTVSGASPAFHTAPQGMQSMEDTRKASALGLTRYFSRGSLTVGGVFSKESDYVSRAWSLSGAISSEDKNTTFNVGISYTSDSINPSTHVVVGETKKVVDLMVGLTQILSVKDIAQANLTYSTGHGYYSDPYKLFGADNRPRAKEQAALLLRWNHHIEDTKGTSRLSYRYYWDTFGIEAHTVGVEYVQPLPWGLTLTPEIRLYSQSAANFYVDPDNAIGMPTIPPGFVLHQTLISEDQRLSAFGARTIGLKVEKHLPNGVTLDLKYQHYEQRSEWRWGGGGSPGLEPLRANIWQFGVSYEF